VAADPFVVIAVGRCPFTTDGLLASDFFDARDAVQVKYEMVRTVKAGGAPVAQAAAAFGYSRPAYCAAAAALESAGLDGLVPARPGPRRGHKLTEEICAWAEQRLAADHGLRPARLADSIEQAFGVRVHPRSVEKAWPAAGSGTPKVTDLPAREERKEEHPSLPLLHHLATRLLNRATARIMLLPRTAVSEKALTEG
jgi:transposase